MRHKDVPGALGIWSDRIMKLLNTPGYLNRILRFFVVKILVGNKNLTYGDKLTMMNFLS